MRCVISPHPRRSKLPESTRARVQNSWRHPPTLRSRNSSRVKLSDFLRTPDIRVATLETAGEDHVEIMVSDEHVLELPVTVERRQVIGTGRENDSRIPTP